MYLYFYRYAHVLIRSFTYAFICFCIYLFISKQTFRIYRVFTGFQKVNAQKHTQTVAGPVRPRLKHRKCYCHRDWTSAARTQQSQTLSPNSGNRPPTIPPKHTKSQTVSTSHTNVAATPNQFQNV